jgi:predicted oxidoreductase
MLSRIKLGGGGVGDGDEVWAVMEVAARRRSDWREYGGKCLMEPGTVWRAVGGRYLPYPMGAGLGY